MAFRPDSQGMLRVWQLLLLVVILLVWHFATRSEQVAFFFGEPLVVAQRIWSWFVVERDIWLKEVHGDPGAPQDRGPCSRRGPRRRLQSGIFVVDLLPVVSARGASVGMSNLVHTTALSSMVITPPMEFPHRDFGQAEMTALAGPS